MQKRSLGRGGPLVGAVGYGAMSFSDFYGEATREGSFDILDACLDLGVDHIDTSNVYGMGRSEEWIGEWLRARGGANPFTIATKAGIARTPEGKRRIDNSREYLEAELDSSLNRLGVDAVDLFYVHRRDAATPIEEVAENLAALVQAGKTKAVGFSEIAPSSLRRAHAVTPIAAVQSEYSLAVRSPELGLVQTCAELGVALVAFSPVGRAILTDRPHHADALAGMSFMKGNPRFQEPNLSANLAISDRFRALAAARGEPAAAIAIAWLLHQGEHILPIPGTRSVAHLREVARGAAIELSAEDIAEIETALPVGWAHGDRYSAAQWEGPERYC
ncbi:aldo/keto reductase [Pikeienuella piscinae]|uniref:Aldo/keto reductase n=1 Tax=Pikeienuella piscinae TaxID=2748098 RepID=A0A7L5BW12_9RHOB|nr:aldo/keto reductase [Pikeienuella piscinae]QIE54416.1 aldo/keto reductase [Pikeienuella piscinae]